MKKIVKSKKKMFYTLSFSKLNSSGLELYEFEKILKKKASGHGAGMGVEDISFTFTTAKGAANAFLTVSKYKNAVDVVLFKNGDV